VSGIRVVSVGGTTTTQVALDADVLVLDGYTLVREHTGHITRLIERNGHVHEAPLSKLDYNYASALFGDAT
jgi:hypothetical protein